MSSPTARHDLADAFAATRPFALDRFQRHALRHLVDGRSVLVAAPTGAGKTVVGEFACHRALETGGKCFYTTPIKALSNQKYRDLVGTYGERDVGLLTGDRSINGEAPVVVMTTEVLRNMLYEDSPTLDGLQAVVLDEVHYLADRARGVVWEEVLIQLPEHVQVAALSATVSNAEEFGDWLAEVRRDCRTIIEERRPVPLRHHYYVNDRIHPTFRAGKQSGSSRARREQAAQARAGVPNPDVVMLERRARTRNRVTSRGRRLGPEVRLRWPDRADVVRELAGRHWLPAIVFVFSRAGCERAVEELAAADLRLTDARERDEIARLVDTMLADLPDEDLRALRIDQWRAHLVDGLAAHHAGLVPAFKEIIEVCFQRGLLKVVVATETLALGINMPAKTVVIERLEKWNGEQHVLLTPGEYTQLTGRAGRRGIDTVGHAVVLYQRSLDFRQVASLVGARTYPLVSSFAPSYNMAVNLLRRRTLSETETLLGASFAQFQTDRSVAGTGARLAELEQGMRGYAAHLTCDRGDWPEYWSLRRELSRREKRQAKQRRREARDGLRAGLAALQPGDVLHLPWLGRRGMAAVVGVQLTRGGVPLAEVVTDDRALTKVGPRELDRPPTVLDRVRLPGRGNPRQRDYRQIVASKLRSIPPPADDPWEDGADNADGADPTPSADPGIDELRAQLRRHPAHACPDRDEHERWQYRYDEVADEAARLREDIERRTGSLVRQLHRIVAILRRLDYLDPTPAPTQVGLLLAGIYSDADLLIAECLRAGVFAGLDPAGLAAVASLFVYEPRGGDAVLDPVAPTGVVARALDEVERQATRLRAIEREAGVAPTRDLDAGFADAAWRWARGGDLDACLATLDMTGGDFVRVVKQLADLLGQLRQVGDEELAATARRAVDAVRRGIVVA